MIGRFWNWLWTPSRLAIGTLLVLGGILGIMFWGGFHTVMEATNSLTFCTGCHEMRPVFNEYAKSPHYNNTSGVKAICSDCHVPKQWWPKVVRKVQATNEIYHKVMGSIDTPEKFEQKRLELAQNVWRSMQNTDSRECRNCHSFDDMDVENQRTAAQKWHTLAPSEGYTCIDCHKGIAHQLPDVTAHYKETLDHLKKEGQTITSGAVITLASKDFVLDVDAVGSGLGNARLAPATVLEVLERKDNALKVKVMGWLRGDERDRLSAKAGAVIPTASLGQDAQKALQIQNSITDDRTEVVWTKAELTGWVSDNDLASNQEEFWGYAAEMNMVTCSSCHHLYAPEAFSAGEWHEVLQEMRHRVSLNDNEYAIVEKYLQINSAKGSL